MTEELVLVLVLSVRACLYTLRGVTPVTGAVLQSVLGLTVHLFTEC